MRRLIVRTSEKSAVQKLGAIGAEFRNGHIHIGPAKSHLKTSRRGRVLRAENNCSGVQIALHVVTGRKSKIAADCPDQGRKREFRINYQSQFGIVPFREIVSHHVALQDIVAGHLENFSILTALKGKWCQFLETAYRGFNHNFFIHNAHRSSSFYFHPEDTWIGAWLYHKFIFEASFIELIAQVNARVSFFVGHSTTSAHIPCPAVPVIAQKVVVGSA